MKETNKESKIEAESFDQLPLARNNFVAMAVSGALIVIGFLLMLGGSSSEAAFDPDIFSTRRIVIGPTLTFLGFVGMAIAVCIRPKKASEHKN